MRVIGWLLLALLVLPARPAHAGPRTPVTVKFVLEAYHAYFLPAQRGDLERKAALQIAERLRAYLPYLEFAAGSGSSYTLSIRLAPRIVAERPNAPKEIGLHLELTGPRLSRAREYIVFRVPEDMRPITTVDDMVQEVDERLPESEYSGRIADLLGRVPIAEGGRVTFQPESGWILPHREDDVCVANGSELLISSTVPGPAGPRLTPPLPAVAAGPYKPSGPTAAPGLHDHIFTRPVDLSRFQTEMGAAPAEQIVVTAVWLRRLATVAVCPQ